MYCMAKYIERLGKYGIFRVMEEILVVIVKISRAKFALSDVKFMYCMTKLFENKEIMADSRYFLRFGLHFKKWQPFCQKYKIHLLHGQIH